MQAWSKNLRKRRSGDLEPEEAWRAQYGERSDDRKVSVGKSEDVKSFHSQKRTVSSEGRCCKTYTFFLWFGHTGQPVFTLG